MKRFAGLLELLATQPSDRGRLALLTQYLRDAPDPDRGWALALLSGAQNFRLTTPAMLKGLAASRIDAQLFALSHDFVGDLAETVALIWPEPSSPRAPSLTDIVEVLRGLDRTSAPDALADWLDGLAVAERWALLRLAGGRLAAGVGGAVVRQSVATAFGRSEAEIAELWHAEEPPHPALFSWLSGRAPRPRPGPLGYRAMPTVPRGTRNAFVEQDAAGFAAEWCWDGLRVQAVAADGAARLYARDGEDLSARFPALPAALAGGNAVVEGMLLARDTNGPLPAETLQAARRPAHNAVCLRVHDILSEAGEDLRPLAFAARRQRLEAWHARADAAAVEIGPLLRFADWDALDRLRQAPVAGATGVVLKQRQAPYEREDSAAPWWAWLAEPRRIAVVLMYARPDGGRGSGLYADLTIGVRLNEGLVPVGRLSVAAQADGLAAVDAWIRANTTVRHGPVREVRHELVLEVAFEAVVPSRRHKAGLVLREPRLVALRDDLSIDEATTLSDLTAMLTGSPRR